MTLLPCGGDHGQQTFDKATAAFGSGAIAQLAPDDPVTQRTFHGIVGGGEASVARKRPQHLMVAQQAPTGGCGGWAIQWAIDFQPVVNVALAQRDFDRLGLSSPKIMYQVE